MLTIGERIKYIRQRRGLTQAQLAEFSGIHPVSIRKYETNKMQPQLAQIEKIARVLCVNLTAISAPRTQTIQLKTVGDLMELLITCHKSGILSIQGKRRADDILDATSVHFALAPFFQNYFYFISQEKKEEITHWDGLKFNISNNIPAETFSHLLRWESLYHTYQLKCTESESVHMKDTLDTLEENLAFLEMELQISTELLKSC